MRTSVCVMCKAGLEERPYTGNVSKTKTHIWVHTATGAHQCASTFATPIPHLIQGEPA